MKYFHAFLFIFALFVFYIRCVSLVGFNTGRSLGKGNSTLTLSESLQNGPRLSYIIPDDDGEGIDLFEESNGMLLPMDVEWRRGVGERVDIGLRLSTSYRWGGMAKVQILGDKASSLALALGLEGGGVFGRWYYRPWASLSYHPAPRLAIYYSPSFTRMNTRGLILQDNFDYIWFAGLNTGFFWTCSKRMKLGLDAGGFSLAAGHRSSGASEMRKIIFNVGLGLEISLSK